MRNYVIINGVNSLTIQGLAINNLPPITKPMIRTQREEIDGRDGDIVTELGYSAYDKQMEIGLYGNFDIDSIIKYFTGEGTIVFSNEADKYYNFKILDQIDYEKLLKFKTAVVTFHCQPFKYPLEEEPVEAEITTITGTGENITLEDTEEAPMQIVYKGNTYQDSTTGKNLYNDNFDDYTQPVNYRICPIDLEIGQTYTLKATLKGTSMSGVVAAIVPYGNQYVDFSTVLKMAVDSQGYVHTITFTPDSTWTSPKLAIYASDKTTFDNLFTNYEIQLEKGSAATSYEPYTNGASPNPSYPQVIHEVSGDNEIVVTGKNLLDRTQCEEDKILTWSGGVVTNNTDSLASGFILANANDKIISTYRSQVMFYQNDKTYIGCLQTGGTAIAKDGGDYFSAFTIPNESSIKYIRLGFRSSVNNNVNMKTANIMVNKGETLGNYEPYNGDTYELNLGVENLFDKDNMNVLNASVSSGVITANSNAKMFYIPCKPNTTYTLSREIVGARFIAYTTEATPVIGSQTLQYADGNNASSVSITTLSNANYLIVYYLYNASENETKILSSIQVEKGSKANSYTPYGTTPIELCKIGDYEDEFFKNSGKNLINLVDFLSKAPSYTKIIDNTYSFTTGGTFYTKGLEVDIAPPFTISYNITNGTGTSFRIRYIWEDGTATSGQNSGSGTTTQTITQTFTNEHGNLKEIRGDWGTGGTFTISNFMVNIGTSALPYEPYGNGDWYLKKNIGKVVLNGTETWTIQGFNTEYSIEKSSFTNANLPSNATNLLSDYFTVVSAYSGASLGQARVGTNYVNFNFDNGAGGTNNFKTWLGTHNTSVYYPLATPTYTLIEGELLNQLEAIKMSYEGQTNISQTNNDLPFELDASVTFLTPMEINNIGNIYAKPILTIEGTGNIGVVLNGIQILEIDLSNNGKITIDVPKLEAYNPDDDSLLNRLVTGDYMKLLINEGENKITFTGEVSGATLTNYIRWI